MKWAALTLCCNILSHLIFHELLDPNTGGPDSELLKYEYDKHNILQGLYGHEKTRRSHTILKSAVKCKGNQWNDADGWNLFSEDIQTETQF